MNGNSKDKRPIYSRDLLLLLPASSLMRDMFMRSSSPSWSTSRSLVRLRTFSSKRFLNCSNLIPSLNDSGSSSMTSLISLCISRFSYVSSRFTAAYDADLRLSENRRNCLTGSGDSGYAMSRTGLGIELYRDVAITAEAASLPR